MIDVVKGVIVKDGKFLLIKRSSYSEVFSGFWEFPGGKVEADETLKECLAREVSEECSLDIKPLEVVKIFNLPLKGNDYKFSIFSTELMGGIIKLSQEHDDYKWVSKVEGLALNIEPFMKAFFNEVNL